MTLHLPNTIAFSTALAVLATGATAATVSSVSVVDTTDSFSETTSDSAIDGDASVDLPFIGSFARQNADGTADVQAGVRGFGPPSKVTATASFEQSESNADSFDRDYTLTYELSGQSADFNFGGGIEVFSGPAPIAPRGIPPLSFVPATPSVTPVATTSSAPARTSGIAPTNPENPFTELDDPETLPSGLTAPISAASFEYIISVNGNEVLNARADALLNGFSPSALVFDAVSGFTPSQSGNSTDGFTFSVAPISGTIDLGTFGAGEELTVTSTLIARSYSPGGFVDSIPISVNTFSNDPVKLFSIGSVPTAPTNPSAVPLPAAGWMLLAALGGMGIASRRKKA